MANPINTLGPELDEFRQLAREAAMAHYVSVAEKDQRPATQRAMDVHKLTEAKIVASGGTSDLLSREASLRGVPVQALAQQVLAMGQAAEQIELDRVKLGLQIDAAQTIEQIVLALNQQNVAF